MKTQTIVLKNGTIITVKRKRKYASIHFDLYEAGYDLTEHGFQLFWKIFDRFIIHCSASTTCGTFEKIPIEQCDILTSCLKDFLNNPKYLERIEQTTQCHLDLDDELYGVTPEMAGYEKTDCPQYKQCWENFE